MPRQSRPVLSEVAVEWHKLVAPEAELPPSEKEARAAVLYDRCFQNEGWMVSVGDAGLVTILWVPFVLRKERWKEAILLCRRYLAHPEARDPYHQVTWDTVQSWLGIGLIVHGEIEAGIEAFDHLLKTGSPPFQYRRVLIRNDFLQACETLPNPPDPQLLAFLSQTMKGWPKMPQLPRMISEAATWVEVRAALESTFPPRAS